MILHNIRQTLRHWQWLAALLLMFTALFTAPAMASVQEMRVVGVGRSDSSQQAAALALDYAKKRAVYMAARKLGVGDAAKAVAGFTDEQLGRIIRGANVLQTRRQQDLTYVEVNVTIVDEALKRALKLPDDYGEPKPADTRIRGVLLLSAYIGRERPYMWEKDNLLRPPLSDEIRRQSHGSVMLPGGDLGDLRLIDYQNMLTVKAEELKPMFARYGAEEIIIAILTPSAAGTTDASSVLLRRLSLTEESHNEVIELPVEDAAQPAADRIQRVAAAVATAVTQIASSTAEDEQTKREKAKKLKITFNYSVPKDLARMQEAVRSAPQVLYLDTPSITLAQVSGTLYLTGDEAELRAELVKQGIVVNPSVDGWRLSVR